MPGSRSGSMRALSAKSSRTRHRDLPGRPPLAARALGRRKRKRVPDYRHPFALDTGDPTGIRTRVHTVKGYCPRPLDDRVNTVTWWRYAGSNRGPLACHASALPAELYPHKRARIIWRRARRVKPRSAIRSLSRDSSGRTGREPASPRASDPSRCGSCSAAPPRASVAPARARPKSSRPVHAPDHARCD